MGGSGEGHFELAHAAGHFVGAANGTLAGLLVVAPLRNSMSANDLIVALAITAVTWTIFWFARHSRQREWLR